MLAGGDVTRDTHWGNVLYQLRADSSDETGAANGSQKEVVNSKES